MRNLIGLEQVMFCARCFRGEHCSGPVVSGKIGSHLSENSTDERSPTTYSLIREKMAATYMGGLGSFRICDGALNKGKVTWVVGSIEAASTWYRRKSFEHFEARRG